MKKNILKLWLALCISTVAGGQQKIENLVIVTTDGLRWQEVFKGMDSAIANQKKFNQGDSDYIFKKYWNNDEVTRRKLLLPFFWNTISTRGQVYGNRKFGNYVNSANPYWFSYPGYNEIFTGYPDTAVNSNEYPDNPKITVLEYLNQQPAFKGKVAAFTAWQAFNRILNEKRSGIPVTAAFDTLNGKKLTSHQLLINKMLLNSYKPWGEGECLDVFTHYAAMEFLKTSKPKVLYIGYGETDEWAHSGNYRDYLNAAHQVDKWLAELWNFFQNNPSYKNKTALLITVDHGRGEADEWTSHGKDIAGADQMWFAIMGPGLAARGEMKTQVQYYQQQLAQTIANLLGKNYKTDHPVAEGMMEILR